jgi:hypothetical protein
VGCTASKADMRNMYKILDVKCEGISLLRRQGIHGKVIFKWILNKQGWSMQTGFIWLWTGTSDGLL